MWFDAHAKLAEIGGTPAAASATTATRRAGTPPRVADVASVATPRHSESPSGPGEPDDADMFRHGRSVTGLPRSWTGRIVSLDAWRQLSRWERHGPDGRLWCGCCGQWLDRGTALAHADARRAEWLERSARG